MSSMALKTLLQDIRACQICEPYLLGGVRPVVQANGSAKILIAGQAPGRKVHESGVPFDDLSGDRLRLWMGINKEIFYDAGKIAILPMGFCFPGTGKSGDLPPRPECASQWRQQLLSQLPNIKLTLVIGMYAMKYHLPNNPQKTITDTVKTWRDFAPNVIPLPHPSPRNNIWLRKNPWFETDVLPNLKMRVQKNLRRSKFQ